MKEQDLTGNKKPLIIFAGRSNVGKSSTIRALTGVKVRVGKRPGSTRWEQMIDLDPITIVDIPGFGFMSGQSKITIEETKDHVMVPQGIPRVWDTLLSSSTRPPAPIPNTPGENLV